MTVAIIRYNKENTLKKHCHVHTDFFPQPTFFSFIFFCNIKFYASFIQYWKDDLLVINETIFILNVPRWLNTSFTCCSLLIWVRCPSVASGMGGGGGFFWGAASERTERRTFILTPTKDVISIYRFISRTLRALSS